MGVYRPTALARDDRSSSSMVEQRADAIEDDIGQHAAPQWQRTLWAMVGIQFVMTMSFSMLTPIMPLFLPVIGVHSESAIDLWSGILAGVTSFVAAFASPLWGRLADRHGRKLMLLRSSVAIGLFAGLMGAAGNVWQLFAFRALMGVFAGFSSTAIALVAGQVPEERLGYALGWLSTGQLTGSLMGPLLGGGLADLTGSYRWPFFIAGMIGLTAFTLCLVLVPERFTAPKEKKERPSLLASFRMITRSRALSALVLVLLLTQFATQSIQPVIVLFVKELVGDRPELGTLAGLAFSSTGLTAVMAASLLGRATDRIGG